MPLSLIQLLKTRRHRMTREQALVQFLTVAGNDFLVPAKGFLLITIAASGPVIIQVDIDESVALAKLAGGEGYNVDAAPGRIAHKVDAVQFHSLFHFDDVYFCRSFLRQGRLQKALHLLWVLVY